MVRPNMANKAVRRRSRASAEQVARNAGQDMLNRILWQIVTENSEEGGDTITVLKSALKDVPDNFSLGLTPVNVKKGEEVEGEEQETELAFMVKAGKVKPKSNLILPPDGIVGP